MSDNSNVARFAYKNKKMYQNNPLLIKTELGKTKKTSNNIPKDIVFGKALKKDPYGVKESIHTWSESKSSDDKLAKKDFLTLNKISVKKHITGGKDLTEFRKTTDIRINKKQKRKKKHVLPSDKDKNHVYGKKLKFGETTKSIVEFQYSDEWVKKQGKLYEIEMRKRKNEVRRRNEITKRANQKKINAKVKKEKKENKVQFKLKQFENVKSRLVTQGPLQNRKLDDTYDCKIFRKN